MAKVTLNIKSMRQVDDNLFLLEFENGLTTVIPDTAILPLEEVKVTVKEADFNNMKDDISRLESKVNCLLDNTTSLNRELKNLKEKSINPKDLTNALYNRLKETANQEPTENPFIRIREGEFPKGLVNDVFFNR